MVSELNILRTKVWSPSSDFTFSVMTSPVGGGGGGSSRLGEVQRANQQPAVEPDQRSPGVTAVFLLFPQSFSRPIPLLP